MVATVAMVHLWLVLVLLPACSTGTIHPNDANESWADDSTTLEEGETESDGDDASESESEPQPSDDYDGSIDSLDEAIESQDPDQASLIDDCQPQCQDRKCGPDPICGVGCGACQDNQECTPQGQCVCNLVPCADLCCTADQICTNGTCCTSQCADLECGVDPCGIDCGDCVLPPDQCLNRTTLEHVSVASCVGNVCQPQLEQTTCCCASGVCEQTNSVLTLQAKVQALGPVGQNFSQYSPWVMHESGWQSHVMYYCKNTEIGGVYRDRVWRTESWNNGLTDWISDTMVIEGSLSQEDDLSCSPGVVIGPDGTWHMYYVTASRDAGMTLYLHHATASAPGLSWTKLGRVGGDFPQPYPGYLETPSPYYQDGQFVIYFVGAGGKLTKTTSQDGYVFTAPVQVPLPGLGAQAGRVTPHAGAFYYFFTADADGGYDPPTQAFMSISTDGACFPPAVPIMSSDGSDWDGSRMWSPHGRFEGDALWLYYSGNIDSGSCSPACSAGEACLLSACRWWGANSTIGVRTFFIGKESYKGHKSTVTR